MAVVTSSLVSALRVGFQREFQDALSSAPSQWDRLSTRVPSSSAGNTYGWIGQFPKLREWSGDRSFKNIKEHGYSVMNNLYEATVDIPRTAVEDDDIGVYAPLFREMGYAAGTHPDEIVFGLLKNGMSGTCYDGKAFFAVDHPVYLNADGSGDAETVSNWLRPAAGHRRDAVVRAGCLPPAAPVHLSGAHRPGIAGHHQSGQRLCLHEGQDPLRHPLPLQRRVRLLAAGRVQHAGAERRQFRRRP